MQQFVLLCNFFQNPIKKSHFQHHRREISAGPDMNIGAIGRWSDLALRRMAYKEEAIETLGVIDTLHIFVKGLLSCRRFDLHGGDKASGTAVIQDLREAGLSSVKAYEPPTGTDKVIALASSDSSHRERPCLSPHLRAVARGFYCRSNRIPRLQARRSGGFHDASAGPSGGALDSGEAYDCIWRLIVGGHQ
jgi:hypothetical protein